MHHDHTGAGENKKRVNYTVKCFKFWWVEIDLWSDSKFESLIH